MNRVINVKKLGLIKYMDAWDIQKKIAQEISENVKQKSPAGHKLLLLEHHPVYTTGIRTVDYSHEEEEKLRRLGADFQRTNRGGLITFHGPGQLTVYPIIHLKDFGLGIRWYVSALERTVIRCLHKFGINSQTTSDTGIWIEDRKICALGIQGRHVTTHGLALNCNIDLSWFEHIVPCGLEGKSVTSVSKELGKDVEVVDVTPAFLESFADVFEANLVFDAG